MTARFEGMSALITGGAQGFGAGLARRLAGGGAHITIADIDGDRGQAVAADVGGQFVRCDVSSYEHNLAAVELAAKATGRLDTVILNAGVTSGLSDGADFDPVRYRKVMGINLDGVIYGFNAALPALRAAGGGNVIATASMAGLAPVPFDAVYAANKHAVVGFVRSAGLLYQAEGIRLNAVCPAFADTAILGEMRAGLTRAGIPLLTVDTVVDVFVDVLNAETAGECWYVQPGRPSEPFGFRRPPGPRKSDGSVAPAGDPQAQMRMQEQR